MSSFTAWCERAMNAVSVLLIVFIAWICLARAVDAYRARVEDDQQRASAGRLSALTQGATIRQGSGGLWLFAALKSDCPYCRKSAPFHKLLARLSAQERTFAFVPVFDEPKERADAALDLEGLSNADLAISDFRSIGVNGTPTLILVDANGHTKRWQGMLDEVREDDVLTALGVDAVATRLELSVDQVNEAADGTSVPQVDAKEFANLARSASPIVLDVRPRKLFAQSHVAGAVNIPINEVEVRAAHELPANRKVLVFCDYYPGCEEASRERGSLTGCTINIMILKAHGFKDVALIASGLEALRAQGTDVFAVDAPG